MEYNSHEDYNLIFAIFSRKQKCIYNDCGRSSDLLPYLNAFPASPNPSKRGEHRSISTDTKQGGAQWQKCCSIRFFNCQLSIVNCQLKKSLQQRVLFRIFTGFPFIKLSEWKA